MASINGNIRRATSRLSHGKIGDCAADFEQSMQKGSSLIGEEDGASNKNVKPTTNNNFLIKIIKPNDNLTGASHYFSTSTRYVISLSSLYDTDVKLGFKRTMFWFVFLFLNI